MTSVIRAKVAGDRGGAAAGERNAPACDLLAEEAASPTVLVGTVARLAAQKGLPYLVEAADVVARRLAEEQAPPGRRPLRFRGAKPGERGGETRSPVEGVVFSVAGDGPMRREIEEEILDRGLEGRFRLLGPVREPWDYLATLDVFVMPSLWEGMPYVLLEAMGAGLPVIATDVGGVEDLIPGGTPAVAGGYAVCEHGIKVRPRDAEALARAILAFARHPRMRRAIGDAARERVLGEFSLENMVEGCLSVYEEAVRR